MLKKITKEYILKERICYSDEEVEEKIRRGKNILTILELASDKSIPFKDRASFIIKKCELTNRQKVELLVGLSECFLPFFEKTEVSLAPREALYLVRKWLNGENVKKSELRQVSSAASRDANTAHSDFEAAAWNGDRAACDTAYITHYAASAAAETALAAYYAIEAGVNHIGSVCLDAPAYVVVAAVCITDYADELKNELEATLLEFINKQTGKARIKRKGMWKIEEIEDIGFELISNEKQWCHFRGFGFDVFVNLDTKVVGGNYFNFRSYKSNFKGNFKAVLNSKEEFDFLLKVIQ